VIRRGFWLAAGAATGIYGYRRVAAIGRRLSASFNPAGSIQEPRLAQRSHRGAVSLARETYRFTRDVREGMDLYMARHSAAAGSTLSTDQSVPDKPKTTHEPEDGH